MPLGVKRSVIAPFAHRCFVWPGEWLQFILVLAVGALVKPLTKGSIQLVASGPARLAGLSRVAEAITIVQQHDVRRYNRIQRSVRRVFLAPWNGLGTYYGTGRICCVKDFSCEEPRNGAAVALAYAYILIYAATAGKFNEKRVARTDENRARIQRVCHFEGTYFLRRFPELAPDVMRLLFRRTPGTGKN